MIQPNDDVIDFKNLSDEQITELWHRFYEPLKRAVSGRVRAIRTVVANDSEVALSAMQSAVKAVQAGRLPDLQNETEFWRVLLKIASRKANEELRKAMTERRGGKVRIHGQAAFEDLDGETNEGQGIHGAAAKVATPQEHVAVEEILEEVLRSLPSDQHRQAVLLKLEGLTQKEIAQELKTTTRLVGKYLELAKTKWRCIAGD